MTNFTVMPYHDKLLRGTPSVPYGLYHLKIATPQQLCLLHYSTGSLTTVKTYLKELKDAGYIKADSQPTRENSHPYYYTLNTAGMNYLVEEGYETYPSWRSGDDFRTDWKDLEHDLGVNDVVASAMVVHKANPAYVLDYYEHERELRSKPYRALWVDNEGHHDIRVIPDARIDFRFGNQRMPVLLEFERDPYGKKGQKFRNKLRAYLRLIESGSYQQIFGTKIITVAFTVVDNPTYFDNMVKWSNLVLQGKPDHLRQTFCFANLHRPITPDIWLSTVWRTPNNTPPLALLAA